MMKEVFKKVLLIILCFFISVSLVSAKTLKDLKDDLAKEEANMANNIAEQKKVKEKIASINNELSDINKEIEECNKGIEESKAKIAELDEEIVEKNKEIDSLLSFKQVSDGDNVYLEYIFGASSFTDFIYRSALVEQLTNYNDQLIDEMYALIEENKVLQKELAGKIDESETTMAKLQKTLASVNLTMSDLDDDESDIETNIKIKKMEVESYEKAYRENGCADTDEMVDCIKMPYASGFTRPLIAGSVTSNFGMRSIAVYNYVWKMHNGMDLGTARGTNVYASAAGKVTVVYTANGCASKKITIYHIVDGKEYRTVYLHLLSVNVKVGDIVTPSTIIGTSGGNEWYDTCSSGNHLHFGILTGETGSNYVDPRNYINFPAKGGRWYTRF